MTIEAYIQQVLPMPPDKAALIASHFEPIELHKQQLVLQEGRVSNRTYFLVQGYMRCFTIDYQGKEVTTRIFSPPSFVNDFLSFFRKEPSKESYVAMTDCKTHSIDFETLNTCFHTIPEFREMGRMLLTLNLSQVHQRMLSLLKDSAETRYLQLLAQHPDIIQNVPLKVIASYLGMTDTSLSRIRKEVAKTP